MQRKDKCAERSELPAKGEKVLTMNWKGADRTLQLYLTMLRLLTHADRDKRAAGKAPAGLCPLSALGGNVLTIAFFWYLS